MSDSGDDWGKLYLSSILSNIYFFNLYIEKQLEDEAELEKNLNQEKGKKFINEDDIDSEEERKKKKAEELKKTPATDSAATKAKKGKVDLDKKFEDR
jgi:hypothetical protein